MNSIRLAALIALASGTALAQTPAPPPSATQAPVALLVDLGAGQTLYAREDTKPFLPASMTKAMSTLIAFDMIASGKLREDQVFTVRQETATAWSGKGTSLYLRAGMQVSTRDLLLGVTTASANDATIVLAEGAAGSTDVWLGLMNARAKALGMTESHFATPNGWPDRGETHVSARDLVKLAQALIAGHPALYRRYIGHVSFLWNGAYFANHDPFAGSVAGADGIKTGHTAEAGYNFLGTAERQGRRLVVVVAGTSSEAARATTARDLIEWGFADWQSRPLAPAGFTIGVARVQDGVDRVVPLSLATPLSVAIPPGGRARISTWIVYPGPLVAPIAKGARIATLEIRIDGGPPASFPLVAAITVNRAGPFDRLRNGLLGLFE